MCWQDERKREINLKNVFISLLGFKCWWTVDVWASPSAGHLLPISAVCFWSFMNASTMPSTPHTCRGSRPPPDSSHDWPPRSLDKLPSFQTFVYPYILLMHLLPAISGDDLFLISMSGLVHQGANFTPAVHHAPACRLTVVRHMVTESLNLKLLLWCPEQVASLKTIRGISRGLLSVLIG